MLSRLEPCFTHKIWGGEKLSKAKGYNNDLPLPLGETWEVSTHCDGSSFIGGQKLSSICELSYLIKFIDTSDNLSVQVHPGDEYARVNENSSGKTECWIILEADDDCGIYLGFKPGITKKEFKTAIENNLEVNNYLNFINVSPGDFFYVPSGAVHAIGQGVTLCEVQQNSGITYRVWDWNRVDKDGNSRQLHISQAMDVLNFNNEFNTKLLERKNLFNNIGLQNFVSHKDFQSAIFQMNTGELKEVKLKEKESFVLIEGSIEVDEDTYQKYDCGISLKEGIVNLKANENSRFLIVSQPLKNN